MGMEHNQVNFKKVEMEINMINKMGSTQKIDKDSIKRCN